MTNKLAELIFNLSTIDDAATELLKLFPEARIFAFYGEMGAGKTTFIKSLCRVLGIGQIITSPTFSIVNEYLDINNGKSYFHFDFYRIDKVEEALDMGYEDYFYSDNMCFLEWPERIEALLPTETIKIEIMVIDRDTRKLRLRE